MKMKRIVIIGLVAALCIVPGAAAASNGGDGSEPTPTLVQQVRDATRGFQNVADAMSAGYASLGSCVSSPEEGAMGIHYGKVALVGDGELHAKWDAASPELKGRIIDELVTVTVQPVGQSRGRWGKVEDRVTVTPK